MLFVREIIRNVLNDHDHKRKWTFKNLFCLGERYELHQWKANEGLNNTV